MAKQWIKDQVRRNEYQDFIGRSLHWILDNRQQALIGFGAAAGSILLVVGLLYRYNEGQKTAWERLSVAQGYAYSGQTDASLKLLKELTSDYGGSKAAGFGLLFAGDIMYRQGSYKEAVDYYSKVIERENPKAALPIALADTAIAQEAAGQFAQAAAAAQRFLDTYSDHFLAPQVHASLARCLQAQGQSDAAKAALQKISLQYPDTPWSNWAQQKLNPKTP